MGNAGGAKLSNQCLERGFTFRFERDRVRVSGESLYPKTAVELEEARLTRRVDGLCELHTVRQFGPHDDVVMKYQPSVAAVVLLLTSIQATMGS